MTGEELALLDNDFLHLSLVSIDYDPIQIADMGPVAGIDGSSEMEVLRSVPG